MNWVPPDRLQRAGFLMRLDRAAADVCSTFEDVGVHVILLKGPSFARWLYEDGERYYGDVDVLAAPEVAPDEILRGLGYEMSAPHPAGIHTTWRSQRDGTTVEWHTTLLGVESAPAEVWRVLSVHTEPLDLVDKTVAVLDEPARAFHAAIHAASDGAGSQAAEDLRRACLLSDDLWREAWALAAQLEATDAFSAGLWLVPEGSSIAERLGIPRNRSVTIELRSQQAPNPAQAIALVAEAKGLGAKLTSVRSLSRRPSGPPQEASRSRLAGSGLLRTILGLGAGLPVWWRARREIRRRSR